MQYIQDLKKIFILILAISLLFTLASCKGEDGDKEAETTLKTDWRNTIEYEGSIFVNESTRLLYAFDTGSITLWDAAGNGNELQVLDYDTSVPDAIERVETEDFSGDGNRDIRIIYSESEKGTRYNLFVWSTKTGRYAECRRYNTLLDPVTDEEGNVTACEDMGIFGTVTRVFDFNETSGLDQISVSISDPDAIAKKIAADTVGGEVKPAEGNSVIKGVECKAYIVTDGEKELCYIAYSPESQWFIDTGCLGFYRTISDAEGTAVPAEYVGEAGDAVAIIKAVSKEGAEVFSKATGYLDEKVLARRYTVRTESGTEYLICTDESGYWYLFDGDFYIKIDAQSGEAVSEKLYEFSPVLIEGEGAEEN